MVKRALLVATLALFCGSAHAQITSNPLLFPSASLVTGNCLQATGQNTVATVAGPCGTASGTGNVNGPTSTTIGNVMVWGNATGTSAINSSVPVASIPLLGASQTWGGLNTYSVRPIFNGATPWDSANFNPALLMPLAGGTFTGTVAFAVGATFNGSLTVTNTGTGPFAGTHFTAGGLLRWNVGFDTAEAGGNTGSDYRIYAYDDTGAFHGASLTINRNTLVAAFGARPTFAGATPWDSANLPAPAPISGVGQPYEVAMQYTGLQGAIRQQGSYIGKYTFARQVTFPAGFVGSFAVTITAATNLVQLEFDGWSTHAGGFDGQIGRINYAPGSLTGTIVTNTGRAAGPITFFPGDSISVLANIVTMRGQPIDATLDGIGITLLGTVSQ